MSHHTEHQLLRTLLDKAHDAFMLCDDQGHCLSANQAASRLTGYDQNELASLCVWRLFASQGPAKTALDWRESLRSDGDGDERMLRRKDGETIEVEFRVTPHVRPGLHLAMLHDISQRKKAEAEARLNEARLESLLRITQHKAGTEQELLDYALEEAIRLTDSKIGYIYYYLDKRREFVLNTWSKEVMDQCRVTEPSTVYHLDKTGVWGEAVRQTKPIILNDFKSPHPLKKGYPAGHVELSKFMTVPVTAQERIVAVAGVANKESDYGDADVRQLTLLMDWVWKMLERRRADEKLEESEQRFRTLVDNAPEAIFIETNGVFAYLNRAGLKLFGAEEQAELLGAPVQDFSQPDDRPMVRECIRMLNEDGTPMPSTEATIMRLDGSAVEVEASAVPFRFRASDGALFFARDISERRRAEKALRESEKKMRSIFSAAPVGIGVVANRIILEVNERLEELTGYAKEDLLGQNARLLYPTEDDFNHVGREKYHQIRQRGRGTVETRFQRKDGRIIDVLMNSSAMDQADLGAGVTFTALDITERNQAEEALRQSEEKFRLAFSTSPDAININRMRDGLYIDINEGFTRLTGYTRQDVEGLSSLDINIWADPNDRERLLTGLREKGFYDNLEAGFLRKDGSLGAGLMSARLISIHDEPCIISITRDVSELKKVAEEKARLEVQLRQAQKMEAIGTLAGGIAHDFNNILGMIIGYTELAKELGQEGAANGDELDQVLRAADRARRLVQQILTFSRKANSDQRPLDLNKIVLRSAVMLSQTLPKMIAVQTELDPDLKPLNADDNQMEQIILNLASNAADAMPLGGALLIETKNISVGGEYSRMNLEMDQGDYIMLQVSDTGCGMDQHTRDQIFDPFFTTKEVGKGTGLGLAMVYGIVKDHGGHVFCYSEPDLGSTFKIFLPALERHVVETENENTSPEIILAGHETILLVDDEQQLRRVAAHFLTAMGYEVKTAGTGEEALEIFKDSGEQLDLLVLDMGMPGMGGLRALREILAIKPSAKVVIASGYAVNGQVQQALDLGARGYVAKPFSRADLLKTVRQALDAD